MARKGTVDRLGPEVRDAIGRLLDQGRTLDEILGHLEGMSVEISRSALGRYTQKIERAGERYRQSRFITDALVARYGDGPESKAARVNIELTQTLVFDLLTKAEDEGDVDLALKLSKALSNLATASRADAELVEKAEKRAADRAKKAAAETAAQATKARGGSTELAEFIKAQILGVQS